MKPEKCWRHSSMGLALALKDGVYFCPDCKKNWRKETMKSMMKAAVMVLAVAMLAGCSITIPPIPVPTPGPVVTTTTTSTTTTTTVAPAEPYGPPCDAPAGDCTGSDSRVGSNPPVSLLSITPDAILSGWANGLFSNVANADGSHTLTAQQTGTGPSGTVYVFQYWRVASSSAANQTTLSVTTSDMGNVTRAYYQAHNPK